MNQRPPSRRFLRLAAVAAAQLLLLDSAATTSLGGQGLPKEGTVVDDGRPPGVVWTQLQGVGASGPSLAKTDPSAAWAAGAVSAQRLTSGDGYVEFSASEADTYRMCGLGNGDTSPHYSDIEHAIVLLADGTFGVYESGVKKFGYLPFVAGDRFRVGVESGVVHYRHNGVVFYVSTVAPSYPLLVDSSFYNPGATLTGAVVLGFVPSLSIDDVSVSEGDTGAPLATFTLTLTPASTQPVSVDYATADGTAAAPADYAALPPASLTFAPGESAKTVSVSVNGDAHSELDEVFFVELSTPVNAAIGKSQGRGTIVDDDPPPGVVWTQLQGVEASGPSLAKTDPSAAWAAGAVSIQRLASGDGYVEFSASETDTYRMCGLGNGDTSPHYSDIEHAVVLLADGTFGVYESGVKKLGYLPFVAGDRFRVGVESGVVHYRHNGVVFYVSTLAPSYPLLVDSSFYNPGATLTGAVVLGFVPSLSIDDVSVSEGDTGVPLATFTLTLTPASTQPVSVDYATADGTATAPADYAALPPASLTFAPGESAKTVSVSVNGDADSELDEVFFVELSTPVNAAIGKSHGRGTIVDDDRPPGVVWTQLQGVEASGPSLAKTDPSAAWAAGAVSAQRLASGDGYVEFSASETDTYRMCGLGNGDTSPHYSDIEHAIVLLADGTFGVYESGVKKFGYLPFVAGDRFRVGLESGVVHYRHNGVVFYVSTLAPSYPLLVDSSFYNPGATLTGAVVLGFVPSLSIDDVSVSEGDTGVPLATFTLTLTPASTQPVSVDYATADGTAAAPADYAALPPASLTFAPGESAKTVSVSVNGDADSELDEVFFVELSTPVNAAIGKSHGRGTIVDDDRPPGVVWTQLQGVEASGPSLTRTDPSAAWAAGAVSAQRLASGDGYVEFSASETDTYRMCGLGNGDTSPHYSDIEHAIVLLADGTFGVYESGVKKFGYLPFVAGDRFRVGLESGVVHYRHNGVVFYVSTLAPSYPLLVDSSFYNPGATVTDARFVFPSVDDRVIRLSSAAQVAEMRRALVQYVWGARGFPADRLPDAVLTDVPSPVEHLSDLARVDEFRIELAPGLEGLAYHFLPQHPNGELVVVQHGHACTFDDDPGPADVGYGLQRTIAALLRDGYGALGVFMPHMRPGDCTGGHDALFETTLGTGSPIQYFLDPTAVSLNYLRTRSAQGQFPEYRSYHMIGFSGGGWTTTVYAAIDPTIRDSFSVAGTIPLYLRSGASIADREQLEPSFYRLAGYPELYVLGAHEPGRGQVQILVRRDDCCFGEAQHDAASAGLSYDEALRQYEGEVRATLERIGGGSFRLEIDETAPSHMISHHTIDAVILPELRSWRSASRPE